MTKYVGSDQRLKSSKNNYLLLIIIGNLLLALGVISQFAPNVLENIMSAQDARLLHDYSILIIAAGILLEVISVISKLTQTRQTQSNPVGSQHHRSTVTATHENSVKHQFQDNTKASSSVIEKDAPLFDSLITTDNPSSSKPYIEWTPIKSGGANFKTHQLVTINPHCIEFKASTAMLLFSLFFAGIGALVGVVFLISEQALIPTLIGFFFTAIGIAIYYFAATPRVFDKQLGLYWKGRCKERNRESILRLKNTVPLNAIYGLQIVSEYVRGDKTSYHSYELNLILTDGTRINVIDHGNHQQIEHDAQTLAQFLKVPIIQPT
jgi:hypothetical protein